MGVDLVLEFGERFELSLDFSHFKRCVLLQELGHMKVTTANSDINLITFFKLDMYFSLSKSVNSLGLPKEKYLHIFSFRILIDELSQSQVNIVKLVWDVKTVSIFQFRILLD